MVGFVPWDALLARTFPLASCFAFPHRLCSVKRPEKEEAEEAAPLQMELFRVSYFSLVIAFSVEGVGLEGIQLCVHNLSKRIFLKYLYTGI